MIQTRQITVLNNIAATATSAGVPVDNASRVSLQIIAKGITSGIGTFTVDVSNNGGADWTPYQRLVPNLIGSNSQTDAFVASKVINSIGSSMLFIPSGDTFGLIRVTGTIITDGTYSAVLYIN